MRAGVLAVWRDAHRPPRQAATRLGPAELARIRRVLDRGPVAAGFDNDQWTLARIAEVIERTTGVAHHPGHVWRILKAMRWRLQRPARKAVERDEAEIARWVAQEWPRIKQTVNVGLRSERVAVRVRRRRCGMTPKQTGATVAFGRAVCRGASVDLAHRLLA
jgi:winged helix-turn-helix protein